MEPSAKGSVVSETVLALNRMREKGRVREEQLTARLSKAALELLEAKVEVGRWYSMQAYGELVDLAWELGGRTEEAMRKAGAKSADAMFERGIYQQLDYADRVKRAPTREDLLRQARLITSVANAFYSYLEVATQLSPSGDEIEIVYRKAAPFTEALRISTEGFMNRVNERHGSTRRWTSQRTRPDEVVFRMRVPERLAAKA